MQNKGVDETLKGSLHLISEVIVAPKTYRVSITKYKMGLGRHHKAFQEILARETHRVTEVKTHSRSPGRRATTSKSYSDKGTTSLRRKLSFRKKLMDDKGLPGRS